jgi:transposase-like protein
MLDEYVYQGARKMLQQAIEEEVHRYITMHEHLRDAVGHRLVVRNGFQPPRKIVTGAGQLEIRRPRVDDRREGHRFSSTILPKYLRRSPSIDALLPVLYLKGVSSGNMTEALEAILGPGAPGLSSSTLVGLKEIWQKEYHEWTHRDLSQKQYVYFWADGIYFNVRLDDDRPCMLVIMGAVEDGTKELVGILDGERESTLSWKELLLELKARGLRISPKLATGDGALGFWAALEEVYGATRQQRCWVHKTANVLDKMPKSVQAHAKRKLHEMYLAETKEAALKAFETFRELYADKYPKATQCLVKDKAVLFTFYDFPQEHWQHIRSTNPIESTFSTVRHRSRQTKGCGSRDATLSMVYKLCREAEKKWRKLNAAPKVALVLRNVKFENGVEMIAQAA